MSVRWSNGARPAVICSGDMYSGEPTSSPLIVMPGCSSILASPKIVDAQPAFGRKQ